MWQRSVGLSGSCGQLHTRAAREEDYCLIDTNPYRERLTSIFTQIEAGRRGFEQKCARCKHLQERSTTVAANALLFCAIHLSCSPSVPTSSMPDKNVSLCTQGPILCLKSHLRLCAPYAVLPFTPSFRPPDCLICQPRSSPPAAAATGATDAFIVLLFLALTLLHPAKSHLPPAQDARPRDLSSGAFIRPSPRPSAPLIPSSWHPVTEEWPVLRARAERDTELLL